MSSGSSPPPRRKTRDLKPVPATATDLQPPPAPTIAEAEDRGDIHRRATVNMQAVAVPPTDIHRRATVDMEAVHGPPRMPPPRRQLDSVDVQAEWMDDAAAEAAAREALAAEEDDAKRLKAPPPWEPAPLPPPPPMIARKRPVTSPIPREDDGAPAVLATRSRAKKS
jgi:hypothetical protein